MFSIKRKTAAAKLLLTISFMMLLAHPAQARDQWQIPRPDPPPTGPIGSGMSATGAMPYNQQGASQLPGFTGMPGQQQVPGLVGAPSALGAPPSINPGMPPNSVPAGNGVLPDFFKQLVGKRLPPGTVLTGLTETDLHSVKSSRGDVFSIILPHGYVSQGDELVPPGSHILGVVTQTHPAATQRIAQPGKLTIALKTLVFPDGRTTPINAFIDHNPAHDQMSEPKTKFGGFGLGDYGQAFKGMLFSSVSGIAWVQNRSLRGKEFVLKAGAPVSVKLNTTLDLSKMTNPTAPLAGQGVPGLSPNLPPLTVPGLSGGAPQGAVPGLLPGSSLSGVPGIPIPQQSTAPGFNTAPPVAPQFGANSNQLPPTGFPGNPVPSGNDPNSIFNTPVSLPQSGMPDPF